MNRSETRLARGSRRHVLDLLERPDFAEALSVLLAPASAVVEARSHRRPLSRQEPAEVDLRAFMREVSIPGADLEPLSDWWVPEEFTGPTWDLLCECRVGGRQGILLVEAKAHVSELDAAGKRVGAAASERALQNHAKIEKNIAEAEDWFRDALSPECRFSIGSHYQLANRLATAEVLARCGVPTVLMYLGFIGDHYFKDFLLNSKQWREYVLRYSAGLPPSAWDGTLVRHQSGGSVSLLIGSLPVRAPSA